MKNMILLLIFAGIFVIAGCVGTSTTSCSSDNDCQDWQMCNTSSSSCMTGYGYCGNDIDCNSTLLECDSNNTHTCVYKSGRCLSNVNCESWQVCSGDNFCKPAPGYCSDNGQCSGVYEYCNPVTHKCAPKAGFCNTDTDCDSWEKCDEASKKCFVMQGRCAADSDCESWQKCDIKTYTCTAKSGFCSNDENCADWARCDLANQKCVARQGYCQFDNQCNSWEFCSQKTHRCTAMKDRCGVDADCGSWQVCAANNTCLSKLGYCTDDADCVSGEICNEATHLCQ